MKHKHLICVVVIMLGLIMSSYATYSRIESMGKSDDFFMDDISIFTNPANINLYANFLTGELGRVDTWESWQDMGKDPKQQWFGGAASYKLNDGSKVTAGVVFNRADNLVTKLSTYNSKKYDVNFTPELLIGQFAFRDPDNANRWTIVPRDTLRVGDSIIYPNMANPTLTTYDSVALLSYPIYAINTATLDTVSTLNYTKNIPTPVGNTEFFLGYTNGKDLHVGGHFYMASQDSGDKENDNNRAESHVYRGDVGVNYGIGDHSLEVAVGIADVSFKNMPPNDLSETQAVFQNPESQKAIFVNVRFFYEIPRIGAKIVPVFGYDDSKVNVFSENNIKAGVGFNKEIEKGLFYAGLTGNLRTVKDETEQMDYGITDPAVGIDSIYTADTTVNSIKFNFGIEKNIAWQWFIVRVGGQKVLATQKVTKKYLKDDVSDKTGEILITSPDENGSIDDVIGFGVGFNFGNKLRVDGTINENFPYQNPFGYLGNVGKRLATRVSATYSF